MSKVVCIKDLGFNYDYAVLLQKNHISEALEQVAFNSLKELFEEITLEGVTTVVFLGELFLEDVLLIEQVDRFTQLMADFETLEFVIAPEKEIQEADWYNIINWPKNCTLISSKFNFHESKKSPLIIYQGQLNDILQNSEAYKLSIHNQWNQDMPRFLTNEFLEELPPSIYIIDTDQETVEKRINDFLELKEFTIEVSDQMTIFDISQQIIAMKKSTDRLIYYRCILKGTIGNEMDKEFLSAIKEAVGDGLECLYVNRTFKNYDVEDIQKDNKDNLIGIFIKNVQEAELDKEEEKRVIETGLDYLL